MQVLENLEGWLKEKECGLESGHCDVNEDVFGGVQVRRLKSKTTREMELMSLMELAGKQSNCKYYYRHCKILFPCLLLILAKQRRQNCRARRGEKERSI